MRIGVARGVPRLLVGKVLGPGGGDSAMLFDAITWAIEQGANVISMSLGFDFAAMVARMVAVPMPEPAAISATLEVYRANLRMFDALMAMAHAGAPLNRDPVVIAASGNESNRQPYRVATSLPAAASDVVSVGALAESAPGQFAVTSFSNSMPVLGAPGLDILSAQAGGGLITMSGTSMACPHVAGVAALWCDIWRRRGLRMSGANVQAKLRATSRLSVIAPPIDEADVGLGMVTAP